MNAPVFFDELVAEALSRPGLEGLDAARELIAEAEHAKREGSGPSQHMITIARRKWLARYDEVYGRTEQ